jgi:hypothetical protein
MDDRDMLLQCRRKRCPVESVILRFVTFEAVFAVTGETAHMKCPHCGGRLYERELFPFPEEKAEQALRDLKLSAEDSRPPIQ